MPITHHIDSERRLVIARVTGTLAGRELFDYQHEVWSRPEVVGFDEFVDMSRVEAVEDPSAVEMRRLAAESAATDGPPGTAGRFAIFAPGDLAFGLGRMYQTYREMAHPGGKEVGVFRTLLQAVIFLGLTEPLPRFLLGEV